MRGFTLQICPLAGTASCLCLGPLWFGSKTGGGRCLTARRRGVEVVLKICCAAKMFDIAKSKKSKGLPLPPRTFKYSVLRTL
jgi:hypothetical protein